MANYIIDPALLKPFLPYNTELDFFSGRCYVSLVGFRFWDTKIKNLSIPFHRNFEEINLRFYVRYNDKGEWKRGVVFIKEIVPWFAITFIANIFYGERYRTMPTRSSVAVAGQILEVSYQWGNKLSNEISITADSQHLITEAGSEEEFITEHYQGYVQLKSNTTNEYKVEHPRWDIYPVRNYRIKCAFKELYGNSFSILEEIQPLSVLLAKGSAVKVYNGKKI